MTKQIKVGNVLVGGGAPVSIQSMTNTRTDDVEATLRQIRELAAAGCEIIRVAVPDMAAAKAVGKIKEQCPLPLVVDIHFDYKLALEAIAAGADKVRINPGNIGSEDREGGGRRLPPEEYPHPHRGERRLSGEAPAGQIRRCVPRSHGGVRLRPHSAPQQI